MKLRRSSNYIGTVNLDKDGKLMIDAIKGFLYGSKFCVRFMGRGSREAYRKVLAEKLGSMNRARHSARSYLPIAYAVRADLYVQARGEARFDINMRYVAPNRIPQSSFKKKVNEIRGMAGFGILKF